MAALERSSLGSFNDTAHIEYINWINAANFLLWIYMPLVFTHSLNNTDCKVTLHIPPGLFCCSKDPAYCNAEYCSKNPSINFTTSWAVKLPLLIYHRHSIGFIFTHDHLIALKLRVNGVEDAFVSLGMEPIPAFTTSVSCEILSHSFLNRGEMKTGAWGCDLCTRSWSEPVLRRQTYVEWLFLFQDVKRVTILTSSCIWLMEISL